jgi:S-formylglutathione hydrolase FrmB
MRSHGDRLGGLGLARPGPARAGAVRSELCPATPARFELLSLPAPSLERSKRIWVYLPPGYDCAAPRRYPVFYLNDGQDLFDWNPFAAELGPALAADIAARDAWYGSWQLEGQLERAVAAGRLPPMIVVGIASDDGLRSRDLAPVPWLGSDEGRGIQYGEFVARTVVGAVDRRYRTVAARRCRGIGGASLGGISALQIGLAHPARFGMVLSFSPVLSDPALAGFIAGAWRSASGSARSAYLVDFDDDARGTRDRGWLAAVVTAAKSFRRHAVLVQTPAGRHAIGSWASRAVPGLEVLFAAQCSRTRPRGFNVQP